jgi:hypothetical protein
VTKMSKVLIILPPIFSDPLNKLVTFQARKKEGTFEDYKVTS